MKYWVYLNDEVPGCYTPQELGGLPGFDATTLVCPAEGEILEKNWRRSGEFPEILKALQEREGPPPPAPPLAPKSLLSVDVNALIDSTGARLFAHVADLVSGLEKQREERSLLSSLQRQLVEVREELVKERERAATLEARARRIAELEESLRQDESQLQRLAAELKAKEEASSDLRIQLERTRNELEGLRRRLQETHDDLAIRNRLVDKLSRDLTDKEMSLAKTLGIIRRLEEDLGRLFPSTSGESQVVPLRTQEEPLGQAPEEEGLPSAAPGQAASPSQESPPPLPPQQQAHGALVEFLRKFLSRPGA